VIDTRKHAFSLRKFRKSDLAAEIAAFFNLSVRETHRVEKMSLKFAHSSKVYKH